MKLIANAVVLASGFIGLAAYGQCESPAVVDIPNGATATLDQMLEAQTAVRAYLAAMEEYLACVNEEIEAQSEETPEEVRAVLIERYNNGVTEMETVAANFNEQRVAYQEANASKSN